MKVQLRLGPPEVPNPEVAMIPGLSKMMLNRLQKSGKKWMLNREVLQ